MGEFSQIMQIVAEQIKSASPQMEVVNSFPDAPRNNPQKESRAVIGIQKVSLQRVFKCGAKKLKSGSRFPFAARVRSSAGKAGRAY